MLAGKLSSVPFGGEILTLFVRVPDGGTVPLYVKVTEPPAGRSTKALMLLLPFVGQFVIPLDGQVHVGEPARFGMFPDNVAEVTADGPELWARMV